MEAIGTNTTEPGGDSPEPGGDPTETEPNGDATKLGLRERKKQQTRETIARVALELFHERGYDETTLAEIAEAADVSPRTIFSYFDSKEEILFCEAPVHLQEFKVALEQRPEGSSTVDAIRDLLSALPPPDESARLRKDIITSSESLQLKMRARMAELEPVLAASFAKDLGTDPDDVRALLIAASATAAFRAVSDRLEAESGGGEIPHERAMAIIDEVLEFIHGGLDRLRTV